MLYRTHVFLGDFESFFLRSFQDYMNFYDFGLGPTAAEVLPI
ncbi:hypothetical protein LEP1GSC188_2587 [Leptospira weilii serovar Topaz str. LT2116]|uniref:Uncharacterized protein n=1 Tax=Leptospira weilii serovar Topaz str. LT2116 TaxID=1088540 RepID=M3G2H5_9LEPT|nr:hypothetical protein LEP1GSC188_2587 [Leptospira weilii serovar Topaz str. LT2116]